MIVTETHDVQQWRFDELIRMGFSGREATELLDLPDIVHEAERLLSRGCPPAVAVRILQPLRT